ncbi:hypothetical protein KDA14_05915 [Candidatus Saccharibacteria bacterium]|nr:hypothetical protein [Candidatus Saccharibacteria bacterium]
MDAYEILVVVLSVLLGIFLTLSIIVVVFVLRLVQTLRTIVEKGERVVDAAEEIGSTLRKNAGAAVLIKMLMKFVANMNKSGKSKK